MKPQRRLSAHLAAGVSAAVWSAVVCGQVLCPGMRFDTCGVAIPAGSNETVAAEFLDMYPDIFIHAQAVQTLYEAAPNVAWLRWYETRLRAAASPVREFDLSVCQIVHGAATNDVKLLNDGLNALKALCERSDHAGMWLAYAVYLAHVDVAQFGRSPHSMSPMKAAVTQAVTRAMAAQDMYPQRGFPLSLSAALAYLSGFPAYAPWCAAVQAHPPPPPAALQYWNGLLCVRGTRPCAGASALAAALVAQVFVIECDSWRTPVQVPSYDDYHFVAGGAILAVRRGGAGYLYRARDGRLAARIPRVAQWEFTADTTIAAVRNALTPPRSYDIELIDLRTGASRGSLYRECATEVRVQRVAVARDGRHAAVQYRCGNGACEVDVWEVDSGTLRGTLANRGCLPVGFTPDGSRLVRSLSPTEYVLETLAGVSADMPDQVAPAVRINTRLMLERYVFMREGAALLCWSQRRGACDAWALCAAQQDGTMLAARAPEGGFAGLVAKKNGAWFATWRDATLDVWSLALGTRPRLMKTLTVPGTVRAVALSAHAPLLAAADARGVLQVWHLDPTGLQAWPAWATGDPSIEWLAFDLASAALYAHGRSNQMIYIAPLQAGGLLDSRTVTGWHPMTRPLMPRQAGPTLAPPPRSAPAIAAVSAVPPLQDTAFFSIRECLTIDYADLDNDGMEEALVTARGAVRALAPGALYFADGVPFTASGSGVIVCPSNDYWYAILRHDVEASQWVPLLMGTRATVPDAGTLPFVSCRFATFSNTPAPFVEHAVQNADGICRRTLYALSRGSLTAVFEYVYHAADTELQFDPARARIVVTEPLYPALTRAAAHVPLVLRTARFGVAQMHVLPQEVSVRLLPAAERDTPSSSAGAELWELQQQAEQGTAAWRYDAVAYASHVMPAVTWHLQHSDGTTAVVRADTPVAGLPTELVLYRPFVSRVATSIWHHTVPRTALPLVDAEP